MLRKLRQRPESLRTVGYVALIVASLGQWFLRPGPHFGAAAVDGAKGLLYGIAIGALLLGMWRRRQSTADPGSCAR
jgi:hypothetical protein